MEEKSKRTRQVDRRANRSLLRRTIVLMAVFGAALFIPLGVQLWRLQIKQHEAWTERAANIQTRDVSVGASRGSIYDSAGNTLAMSATVYNLILSPKDLIESVNEKAKTSKELQNDAGEPDSAKVQAAIQAKQQLVRTGLVELLGLDDEKLAARLEKTNSRYQVLAYYLEDEQADAVRAFIKDNKLSGVLSLMPTSKRYYLYSSVGSHLLGFMAQTEDSGENKVGRLGLERVYEDELSGQAGRVVTATTGRGFQMLSSYENYLDAEDGENLTLTLDITAQSLAEQMLQEGIEAYDVKNGGFVIAMNPNTGAIYAMASSPDFDPNNYSSIIDSLLSSGLEKTKSKYGSDSDEYKEALTAARNKQWRNKALSDTYEPGSTFKALVVAAALEEGVISMDSTYYCGGASTIGGRTIHCHKRAGHGSQTLTQAVENSCNVALMEIGQRLGAEKFWQYLEDYGFFEKTGIDLAGEGNSVFWAGGKEYFTSANGLSSLAVASFGQTFKVTPIQMITAFASVINGGHLIEPYVVEKISDSAGNTVSHHETVEVRQVLSESTSEKLRGILESVVANGTGGNAYMAGYRIGGKTGTSEKRDELDSDDVIVSFMGFAPADNPQVLVLVAMDSPTRKSPGSNYTASGTYISGGNMAAPIAGQLIAKILDNMGVEKQYSTKELSGTDTVVPSLVGLDKGSVKKRLEKAGFAVRMEGSGSTVTGQVPSAGLSIPGGSTVIVYLGEAIPEGQVEVPNLQGLSPAKVKEALESRGLFLRATGVSEDYSSNVAATGQSIEAGTQVAMGTVVEVHFISSVIDYARN